MSHLACIFGIDVAAGLVKLARVDLHRRLVLRVHRRGILHLNRFRTSPTWVEQIGGRARCCCRLFLFSELARCRGLSRRLRLGQPLQVASCILIGLIDTKVEHNVAILQFYIIRGGSKVVKLDR